MQRGIETRAYRARGYSAGRKAYDRRRRRVPLDAEGRMFKALVQRDPCAFCGKRPPVDADHVVPLSDHGENAWTNLGGVCVSCNRSKGNRPLWEYLLNG